MQFWTIQLQNDGTQPSVAFSDVLEPQFSREDNRLIDSDYSQHRGWVAGLKSVVRYSYTMHLLFGLYVVIPSSAIANNRFVKWNSVCGPQGITVDKVSNIWWDLSNVYYTLALLVSTQACCVLTIIHIILLALLVSTQACCEISEWLNHGNHNKIKKDIKISSDQEMILIQHDVCHWSHIRWGIPSTNRPYINWASSHTQGMLIWQLSLNSSDTPP